MLRFPLTFSGLRAARLPVLLICLVGMLFATEAPQAEAKFAKRVELGGKNLETLKPNCGRDFSRQCVVEGKMTGFQALSAKSPGRNFVVPYNGKLVSWAISLADVTRRDVESNGVTQPAQLPAFGLFFGTTTSQARISILRQVEVRKKGAPRFKLVRQGPLVTLNPYFGSTVRFTLDQPLNVYKNNVVALTTPTWVPALWKPRVCDVLEFGIRDPEACEQAGKTFTWRASRMPQGKDECVISVDRESLEPNETLAKSRPQQTVDSVKRYGCYYGANALLYSATIVAPAGN